MFGLENEMEKKMIVEQRHQLGSCVWEEVGGSNRNEVWGLFAHLRIVSDSPIAHLIKSWTIKHTV